MIGCKLYKISYYIWRLDQVLIIKGWGGEGGVIYRDNLQILVPQEFGIIFVAHSFFKLICLLYLQGPESVTSPEVLESTSAPDLTTSASNKPSNILKNSSSSCDLKSPLHDKLTEKNNLKSSASNELIKKNKSNFKISENAINRANAAYQKMQETSPYNQSVENLYVKRARRVLKAHKRTVTHPPSKAGTEEGNEMNLSDTSRVENNPSKQKNTHSRSHSQPSSHPVGKLKYDDPLFSKVRNCKKAAETAIKVVDCWFYNLYTFLKFSLCTCYQYKIKVIKLIL